MSRILRKGVLKKRIGNSYEKKEYVMELLGIDRIPEVIDLQNIVVQKLSFSEIFQPDSKEFIKQELVNGGKIIGVYSEDELVAYRFITIPKKRTMNLGEDLHISKKELQRVGHLESTIVHPDYRGNGLQRKTLKHALAIFDYLGYYHVCSTISPKNYHSLKNIMSGGLVIKKLKEKYGGKMRFILHRNLKNNQPKMYTKNILINDINILKEEKVLERGFEGYQAIKNDRGFAVTYGM